MGTEVKERFIKHSLSNDEKFSKLEALLTEIEHFKELTSKQLLRKIKKMSQEGLDYNTTLKQDTQLFSIYLALETYFHLKL